MPQVGNRKFAYTKEGEQEAAAYAAETEQEVVQQDSYGYARGGEAGKVTWDDPWGDNIQIPYRNDEIITGPEADKLSPGFSGFQAILYKGHTGQEIIPDSYDPSDVEKAKKWYEEAQQTTAAYIDKYSDNPKVMSAQERKMREIQRVLEQLGPSYRQRGGFAGSFGYGTTRGMQTGGVTGQGLDYSETLNDEKQMFRDKEGNYTVNLAKQYQTPEGLRYYEGTGQSPDMFFAESMAETDARRVLSDNPADSLVTGGKRPYAKDGLIRSILGKFGF